MFGFFQNRKKRAFEAEYPLVAVACQEMNERLHNGSLQHHLSEEAKQAKFAEITDIALAITHSENQLLTLREKFADHMTTMCAYEVLVHGRKPTDHPGVSADLHQSLHLIRAKNSIIKEMAYELSEPDDKQLLSMIQITYEVSHSYVTALNAVRIKLGDCHPDPSRDWLQPFRISQLVWWEDVYRRQIGMPPLVERLVAIGYSTFINFVRRGDRYPNLAWEEQEHGR